LKIALDIDGVLADQVGAVLERIEKEYGRKYSKSEVNQAHWSFGGRDIWMEISKLLTDPEYVLAVPVIDGSQLAIQQLGYQDLCVVTARRPETEEATKQWLSKHFPSLNEYYHARTGTKHSIPSDVLIDDFDLNIVEFVKSDPSRRGILFKQPWSINNTGIEEYADQVYFCNGWQNVLRVISEIDDCI
jgi:5'(3')-deoxyribonucleotidase